MMRRTTQIVIVMLSLLLTVTSTVSCGNDNDENAEKETGTTLQTTAPSKEKRVFKIGNITDLAGPSSAALVHMNMALEDTVKYYNEENLIPGLELEVVVQDAGFDPTKYISSYEWLTERQGADLIFSADPNTLQVLKPLADSDHFLVFASNAQDILLENPGYVFTVGTHPVNLYYTLMEWISQYHWDYQTNGPAKVGVAGWRTDIEKAMAEGVEIYCADYPERFEWKGKHLRDLGFDWESQANALKDCDYILPPAGSLVSFLIAVENAGGNPTYIGGDPHTGFFKMLDSSNSWERMDGMIFVSESALWDGKDEIVMMTQELLQRYRADIQEEIKQNGYLYLITGHIYVILDIIKKAVDEVGIDNLDSETIYQIAQSYELNLDGVDRYSFTPTKRFGCDALTIYEADFEGKTLERIHEDWIPLIRVK